MIATPEPEFRAEEPAAPETKTLLAPSPTDASRDSIGDVVNGFVREIDSLSETLPLAMLSIRAAERVVIEQFDKFVRSNGKPNEGDPNTLNVKADDLLRYNSLASRVHRVQSAGELVPRSFVVALISQYDAFLGQLMQALFLLKPETLNGSERTVSFSELVSFGSIEAARDHVIEREVETVLRKSHAEHFEWLERRYDIKLREGLPAWPTFVELTERRNLFVHSGGIVSQQYLAVCSTHGVPCKDIIRGTQLSVTDEYFKSAYRCVFEIGVKLAHVLWRKVRPDQRKQADQNLIDLSYTLLSERRFKLAQVILDFATDVVKKHSSDDVKFRFIVNRAQAYKWAGDDKTARRIVQAQDFSALSDVFRLAEAVLLDDVPGACAMMRKIGAQGEMTRNAYRDWPLFQAIRKEQAFADVFAELFAEPLHGTRVKPPALKAAPPQEPLRDPPSAEGDDHLRPEDPRSPGAPDVESAG